MSKVISSIIGHAIGDAMGVPVEFKDREQLLENPVTDMRRSYAGNPGIWSDDTSMEIATIDSYINNNSWNYDDIMINFGDWINDSKYTAAGYTFDVGRTCLSAIRNYLEKDASALESGLDDFNSNGNGSLMRILPVAIYCYKKDLNKNDIYQLTKNISSLTHRHEISILGCYIYVLYTINLFKGIDKQEAYDIIKNEDYSMFSRDSVECYYRILKDDLNELTIDDIKSSGYIVDSLEASMWVLLKANNYIDSILGAVNLGGDTDTIAAITGSMAGIIYGYDAIPKKWINQLARKDYLLELSEKFENCLKDDIEILDEPEDDNSIEVIQGDLTSMDYDIIVNAANESLMGGGGIDGIIHYKAGPELLEECKKLNGCEIGSAKMTDAYNLPCKKIIHACGPVYYGNREKAPSLLKSCYKKCLEIAEQYRVDNKLDTITIGFPCISTGIYGYPKDEACKIAIDTVKKYSNKNIKVKLVCYDELDYKLYMNYINGIEKSVFEL